MVLIKWGSVLDDCPVLEFAKPIVPEHMKRQAEKSIPIPANCKPWLDAQSAGLIIKWPHETTTLIFKPNIESYNIGQASEYVEAVEAPSMEWQGTFVGRFAPWHFSLLPQYVFRTPPGIGLYVVGLPDDHKSPLDQRLVVRGILETDWYSVPPFFVYHFPYVYCETAIVIDKGDPLCMVVPVMLNPGAEQMTPQELEAQLNDGMQYINERNERDDLLWYSTPSGQMFSHLYKERSRRFNAHRS